MICVHLIRFRSSVAAAVVLAAVPLMMVRADEPKPAPAQASPIQPVPPDSPPTMNPAPTNPPADRPAAPADPAAASLVASPDAAAPREQPSSLDELLGLEQEPGERSAETGADQTREQDLSRALDQQAPGQALAEALLRMGVSAELLDVRFDPGLGTQRVQQEVLAKLDELIEMAKNMSSSSGSSSSSSAGSPRSSRSQPAPPKQAGASKPNSSGPRNSQPAGSQEGDSPPIQEGDINTVIDETRQEWGNLPPRVRDMMLQGRTSRFSSLYQRLTEEYYKRLAEETAP